MSQTNLLSADAIAKNLGRHPVSVWRAIQRLKLEPKSTSGPFKFYDADDQEKIREAMRAPNRRLEVLP